MFKLSYSPPPGNDIASLTVTFHAPNWVAAEGWALAFCKQLGIDPKTPGTTITRESK